MNKFLLKTIMLTLLLFSLPYSVKIIAKENPTSIHFLNTIDNQCILIQNIKENLMIDMGGVEDILSIKTYLNNENITNINSLILTEYTKNSLENLKSLLESISIEKIMLPDYNKDSTDYLDLVNIINSYNISISYINKGWTYNKGNTSLEVKLPLNVEDNSKYNRLVILAKVDGLNYLLANETLFSNRKNIYKLGDIRGVDCLYLSLKESINYTKEYLKYINPKLFVVQHKNSHDYNTLEKILSSLNISTIKSYEKGNIKVERVLGSTNKVNISSTK